MVEAPNPNGDLVALLDVLVAGPALEWLGRHDDVVAGPLLDDARQQLLGVVLRLHLLVHAEVARRQPREVGYVVVLPGGRFDTSAKVMPIFKKNPHISNFHKYNGLFSFGCSSVFD